MGKRKKIAILLHLILLFFVSQELRASSLFVIKKGSDTIFIPSASLYEDTWGGENTRLRTNLLDIHQNYILPLQTEGENMFVFPCINKTYVCSFYGMRNGRMHTGMDIKQKLGDSIIAAWDGIVRMAQKNYYAYGNIVVIRHSNGLETLYAHLSDIHVKENQAVKAGELIGCAGKTGRATTEHLHFETRFLYEHFDPQTIIDFNTFSLYSDTLYVSNGKFSNQNFLTQDSLKTEEIISFEIPSSQNIYIVKKGDTLYAIAKKYNIGINDICQLNNIEQKSMLYIGQKLKLK
jgi:murein DD-endopeptidase MepM/ murein hydrolase activator NlpD